MELPERFLASLKQTLGDEYEEFIKGFGKERAYGLRVNTSKLTAEEFEKIAPFAIRRIPWIPNGYFYDGSEQPAKHPYYHAGLYYLQEPSAMTPASRLPVVPGERVLDLCAAPGGKATELGVRLGGEGVLVANDASPSRAKALLKNLELFGIPNLLVTCESSERLCAQFEGYFDKVLVDAPCSGEGMFRKDPSIIKNWERLGVEHYAKLQRGILPYAAKMLRAGGRMLYSTCTFSVKEDEEMVQYLLERNEDLSLVEMEGYEGFARGLPFAGDWEKCVRIWPHKMQGEGHFMALFEKRGEASGMGACQGTPRRGSRKSRTRDGGDRESMEEFREFMKQVFRPFEGERLEWQGNKAYYMPCGLGERKGMRFLRNGLYLGERKKKRFEPSQALAMSLKGDEYDSVASFSREDERVFRYLKGESVNITDIPTKRNVGWQLVCVDGFPLGWGKLLGKTLKNKYQTGWRYV